MRAAYRITAVLIGTSAGMPFAGAEFASAGARQTPPATVDLAGTWLLDPNASDRAEAAMPQGRQGAIRRGAGGGGSGGGGRVIIREDVRSAMEQLAQVPDRLVIEQTEGEITLRSAEGISVQISTTGRRVRVPWFDGGQVNLQATWRRGILRIERSRDNVSAVDTYSREPGATELKVVTTLTGGMGGEVHLQRLYRLEPPSESP